MQVFAQSGKEALNQWLEANPLALGAGALVLGLIFVGLGVSALLTGRAVTKRGRKVKGGEAKALAYVWLGFGIICVLFGAFKVVSGVL
jgi:MFS family permease